MTTMKSCSAIVVAACAVAAVSACGSGGDAGASNPSLTKSPIVIGMANASTGPADGAQTFADEEVAKAWEQWVNKDLGGINGHPVKVVIRDTKNDPATAVKVANQLINDDKVVAEVGGGDSVTAGAWVPVFDQARVPVIGGQIVDDSIIAGNPYFYSTVIGVGKALPIMIDVAKETSATAIAGVVCAESPSCTQAEPLWRQRSEQLGMKWGGLTQVRVADANYAAACVAIKQAGANYALIGTNAATTSRVVTDCNQQQLDAPFYGLAYGSYDGKLASLSKKGANFLGVFGGFPWFLNNPAAQNYRDVMKKYAKGGKVPENPIQGDTWNGLEMFRKAMAQATGNPTAAEVARAMSGIKNEDLGGLLPQKVSYAPVGQVSPAMTCMWQAKIVKGEFLDAKPACLAG